MMDYTGKELPWGMEARKVEKMGEIKMRTEEEVTEFMDKIMKEPSLTNEQRKIMIRTLRWVIGLEDKVIL